jgi:Uma2 family endonuclease
MAAVALKDRRAKLRFGADANGIILTPTEFDRADFDENWRFELINGVLVVTPLPFVNEVDPNEELGYLLRAYKEYHPLGAALNATLPERIVRIGNTRRRADRLIWAGLGRVPRRNEHPTIIAEFVSRRKRDQVRDYETKRAEYASIKVEEYWVFDRFRRILTVFALKGRKRVIREEQVYTTPLLPGFDLPLARLFAVADRWPEDTTLD